MSNGWLVIGALVLGIVLGTLWCHAENHPGCGTRGCQKCPAREQERNRFLRLQGQRLELLRELEWSGTTEWDEPGCPSCNAEQVSRYQGRPDATHRDGCATAARIAVAIAEVVVA